ncbi:hypothetical protein ACH5RR_022166 [Cinchona calisaya]|uniref:TF-B3 domain-containing protein n=1 Tax=Cinchona calisaya TaxID=153742 RepID=A0ABD2Z717_9GENT
MPSPCFKLSKQKQFHQSLKVVAKKPVKSRSCRKRMAMMHDLYDGVGVASSVMQRAEAVQENLDAKFPSLVKPMIRSNVSKGFWLSLPRIFCKLHLPSYDTTIVLEDEDRKEYFTKYLAQRNGLSAGWMGFSVAHNLVEGDVLVFHMVKFDKLKVYIIRTSVLAEVDAALCLMQLDAAAKQKDSVKTGHRSDYCRGLQPAGEKISSCSETVCKNGSDKDMQDNNMGLVMDHPQNISWDPQVALEGLITETYSIADAVKASRLNPFSKDFAILSRRMVVYEQMRNHLSRIHARLDRLVCLVLDSKEPFYCNSRNGIASVQNRGRDSSIVELNMLELKEAIVRLYAEIGVLKINAHMLELKIL